MCFLIKHFTKAFSWTQTYFFSLNSDLYSLTKDLTYYYIQCLLFFQGAYKGPIMNSEHLAGILAILVFYCAYTSKANLLA